MQHNSFPCATREANSTSSNTDCHNTLASYQGQQQYGGHVVEWDENYYKGQRCVGNTTVKMQESSMPIYTIALMD